MSICDKCLHREICCDEDMGEEALKFCAHLLEERPKGKWLKSSNMSKRSYQRLCSNCKHIVYFCGDGNYPNCPYCLADMKGEEE